MYVPAQAVGNAAVQAGGPSDGGTAEMARLRETAQAIQTGEENGAAMAPVQAETAVAVQPTPVSAKAVKVDLDADRAVKEGVVEYPITGPDKFARTIAEAKKYAYEEEQRAQAKEALDQAAEGRQARAAAIEDKLQVAAQAERKETGEAFVDRGPAVSGSDDSAIAESDRVSEAKMVEANEEKAFEKAAEKRREEG